MQPTEQRFNLKCKVVVKDVSYADRQSKGESLVTEKLVYLIPQESTQRDLFLAAWLPDTREQSHEIGLTIGHPVSGFVRACVKRRNEKIAEHHIFVMSKGAEEDIKDWIRSTRAKEGEATLCIEVLGEHEDELLDMMRDHEVIGKKEFDNPFAAQGK